MSLIHQRTSTDCGIASIAMATGQPYERVLEAAGPHYDPTEGLSRLSPVLRNLGFKDGFDDGEPSGEFVELYLPWGLSTGLFRRMIFGRRAIVSVPSKVNQGGWHLVFWNGRAVLDPNPDHLPRYTKLNELEPQEIVLFREVPA